MSLLPFGAAPTPVMTGDSGSGGKKGSVPAPPAYSAASGDFLSAGGAWTYVDQSKTVYPTFSLITQAAAPSGAIKFETTTLFTSITTGKQYAIGVGFIDTPTLTIWDVSDQTRPVLASTYAHSAGGAYNCTVGVVAGVQYVFIGYNSGSKVDVVNLTNPTNPVDVGTFTITGSPGSIYGVSFLNGYVYCATQSTGLVVLDVGGGTGSPSAPVQTYQQGSSVKSFGVVATGSNVYTTSYSTSSPYTTRQIISWTLSGAGTPAIPSLLQSLQVTAAGEALGLSVNGNTAFVTTAATGAYNINLVDITTPSSMSNLSQINSSNTFGSAFFAVGVGNYVYVPSGGNATYGGAIDVYDITTRTTPLHIAQTTTGVANALFGGIAISGGYIFCADYGNSAGTTGTLDVFQDIRDTLIVGALTTSSETITGMTTAGVVVNSSAGVLSSVAPGTSGNVLTSTGTGWTSSAPASSGVTAVTGSGNIASSGGTTPNITFTGVLPIANGGTDNASLAVTAGGVIYTDGTKLQNVGIGTSGQVLTSNGSSAPNWQANPSAITNNSFNGYLQLSGANYWACSTSSFSAPSATGGSSSLTTRNSNSLSISAASSNALGITFSPSASTSIYWIYCSLNVATTNISNYLAMQLTDGTNVFANSGGQYPINANFSVAMSGLYLATSTSPVTISLYALNTSGGMYQLGSGSGEFSGWTGVEWQIFQTR